MAVGFSGPVHRLERPVAVAAHGDALWKNVMKVESIKGERY